MKKDSKTKIARVYALALYEAAEERKAVPQVSDDMMKLLDAVRAGCRHRQMPGQPAVGA